MSYQFSFLQAFAGYYFVKSKFLTTLKQNTLLKRSQEESRVHFSRQFEIMRLQDIGKYRTHICHELRNIRPASLYWTAVGFGTLSNKCLYLTINGLNNSNNQLFWQLINFFSQPSRDCTKGYIFDTYLIECLCKYLFQSQSSRNKKISDLQSNLSCRIYQSFESVQVKTEV
ncbi:hypothetical protein NIES267_24900 [Calothrix parasitica NIES-267]|uniref:Uncharacterized protein n=1 Tax=Calothrix parasitica NIES-267 TaxID=1973488 RepID=A0A1Z4LPB3_9CYAN|nr:hypothetical protein NIES267_24900 [Calothrix parasitica NIES-267]